MFHTKNTSLSIQYTFKKINTKVLTFPPFVILPHASVNALSNTGGISTSAEHLVPNVCILNMYSAFKDLHPITWKIYRYKSVNASFCDKMHIHTHTIDMHTASVPARAVIKGHNPKWYHICWQRSKTPLATHTVQSFCTHSVVLDSSWLLHNFPLPRSKLANVH